MNPFQAAFGKLRVVQAYFLRSTGLLFPLLLCACAQIHSVETRLGIAPAPDPNLTEAISQSRASLDSNYTVGPEDVLEISVWKEDNLKKEVLVRPDGGISFPLAGDLRVAGQTPEEIRDELTKRIAHYIPDPSVSVSVLKAANYKVYVIGRVNKPGDLTSGRPLDVLQALSMAGGLTPFASDHSIHIVRTIGGKSVAIPFDYVSIRDGEDLDQNILLKSGDVVVVP
jgi:polysaccharide export outer membrane protein